MRVATTNKEKASQLFRRPCIVNFGDYLNGFLGLSLGQKEQIVADSIDLYPLLVGLPHLCIGYSPNAKACRIGDADTTETLVHHTTPPLVRNGDTNGT